MPFRTHARIVVVNDSDDDIPQFYYCIEATCGDVHGDDMLYFHAVWHCETRTKLGQDFEILPKVTGTGRFLGMNVNVLFNQSYHGTWFGEGEVKIYLDGDTDHPTLVCSGTEDYIGSAWGQGEYSTLYMGCTYMNKDSLDNSGTAFYRFHVPDPVWFEKDCRVTLQQIGSCGPESMQKMLDNKADIQVIYSVNNDFRYGRCYLEEDENPPVLSSFKVPDESICLGFYRSDDVSAVAYYYLDKA